jgi:LCP family protein required for cell wall assembly
LWAKLLLTFGVLLLLGSGGSLVGGKLLLDHYSSTVTHSGGLGSAAAGQDQPQGNTIAGAINLLLVGIDEREGQPDMGARADSIIIAHVPATHDAVYLTSIPRDLRVKIPADKVSKYGGGQDKINAAFEYGYQKGGGRDEGLALLAETVSNLAGGLKFNGAAIVNFSGFSALVNALGGVHMCVDEPVTSVHTGWNTKTGVEGEPYNFDPNTGSPTSLKPNMRPLKYEVGCYDFAAWQALDYVRQRDKLGNNDADYGRQRHQQQFIKAMLTKATSAGVISNPATVVKVLNSVGKAVSFYNNNISLADWVFTLKGLKPDKMVTLKVNNGTFQTVVIGGQDYETLDANSQALLSAIGEDQVGAFVAQHPEMINSAADTPATPASPNPNPSPSKKR